jgi:predicted nucleotidyltransferase
VPREAVAGFCRKHHIRRLALFGSVLRDDFRPDSDVDVLVEFEPSNVPGYFAFFEMEQELGGIVGRKVDLNTPGSLSKYFRARVLAEAVPLHDAA